MVWRSNPNLELQALQTSSLHPRSPWSQYATFPDMRTSLMIRSSDIMQRLHTNFTTCYILLLGVTQTRSRAPPFANMTSRSHRPARPMQRRLLGGSLRGLPDLAAWKLRSSAAPCAWRQRSPSRRSFVAVCWLSHNTGAFRARSSALFSPSLSHNI